MEETPVKRPNSFLGRAMWERPEPSTNSVDLVDQVRERLIVVTAWRILGTLERNRPQVSEWVARIAKVDQWLGQLFGPDSLCGCTNVLELAADLLRQRVSGELWLSEISADQRRELFASRNWHDVEQAVKTVQSKYNTDLEGKGIENPNSNN